MAAADGLTLKARIRKRDRDIREEVQRRINAGLWGDGIMADIVREGVRQVFFSEDPKPQALDPIFAELKEKDPGIPEDVEVLVDELLNF